MVQQMNEIQKFRDLLHEAARLDERWRTNRPEPFNVFTALRSASDEVNLHSRFLHALLNYVDPASGDRENLIAFLREVAVANDFSLKQLRVNREWSRIDLLISNQFKQAVIIENKIWHKDTKLQLQGYHDGLIGRGYVDADIRIVYLTLDGRNPDPESQGEIPDDKIEPVSYGGEKFQSWLHDCQRRAFNEPGLRETIAQYLHLVRRMTNTDYKAEHMNELKELLMRDDNLMLARDVSRAMVPAKTALFAKFYEKIDVELRNRIKDLPEFDHDRANLMKEKAIKECMKASTRRLNTIRKEGRVPGLYYRIAEGAWLSVTGGERLWLGVWCGKTIESDLLQRLKKMLSDQNGKTPKGSSIAYQQHIDELPAWRSGGDGSQRFSLRGSSDQCFRFLSEDGKHRGKIVEDIVNKLSSLWVKVNELGIADQRNSIPGG